MNFTNLKIAVINKCQNVTKNNSFKNRNQTRGIGIQFRCCSENIDWIYCVLYASKREKSVEQVSTESQTDAQRPGRATGVVRFGEVQGYVGVAGAAGGIALDQRSTNYTCTAPAQVALTLWSAVVALHGDTLDPRALFLALYQVLTGVGHCLRNKLINR